jgi:hypothetical protein
MSTKRPWKKQQMSPAELAAWKADMAVRTAEAGSRLTAAATELLNSDGWKAALRFASRSNRSNAGKPYSFRNLMLLMAQRPDASRVMSAVSWRKLGRFPLKGETALRIWAPATGKKNRATAGADVDASAAPDESLPLTRKRQFVPFRLVPVFDVTQTQGDPLPEIPNPAVLDLPVAALEDYWTATCGHLTSTLGCTINQEPKRSGHASGFWRQKDKLLWVSPELPRVEQLAVLLHEGGHALAGHTGRVTSKEYDFQEVIAESTAFLALDHFGIPAEDHSVPYLAPYAKEPTVLIPAIQEAIRIAREFIGGINAQLTLLGSSAAIAMDTGADVEADDDSVEEFVDDAEAEDLASPRVTPIGVEAAVARVHPTTMPATVTPPEEPAHA